MVSLENAEGILKSVYLSAVTDLLNTKSNVLMAKIPQTTSDVWGKGIRKIVKYGINGGIGAGDETGDLPTTSGTGYLTFETTLKNLYGQIEISDKAIRATSGGKNAFVDLLNDELEGLLTASKFNLSRMLYGDGSGLLTRMSSPTTVSSPSNIIEGMLIDIYRAGVCMYSKKRVKWLDRVTRIISFEGEPITDLKQADELYIQGSKGKEITGLGAIFKKNSTLYGVDRNEYQFLNPVVSDSPDITEKMLAEMLDNIEMKSGGKIDIMIIGRRLKYSFQAYMRNYRQNIEMMDLQGGYRSMTFAGLPLVYDRFADSDSVYMLDSSAFKLHQLCDWRYLENENGKILRQVHGKPTFTATLVKYCDLICERPQGQGFLTGTFQGV